LEGVLWLESGVKSGGRDDAVHVDESVVYGDNTVLGDLLDVVRNELDVWLVDATVKADKISAEGQGKTAKKQSRHSRFHEGNAWRDSAAPDVEAARKGTLPRMNNRPAPRISRSS
jgi:hypothetical protein